MPKRSGYKSVDEYISSFPKDIQKILQGLRKAIINLIPDAEEVISYQIPTYEVDGKYVVYFAAFKNHISLYPIPDLPGAFKKKIGPFVKGKGTVQFPVDKPLPFDLIKVFVKYSLKAHGTRSKSKKSS